MYKEIAEVMESFFTTIGKVNAIINASNIDIKLMTYLTLAEGLESNPNNYKRVRTIEIPGINRQAILVINSEIETPIIDDIMFNGKPTTILIYPESVTLDDGSDEQTKKYIVAGLVTILDMMRNELLSSRTLRGGEYAIEVVTFFAPIIMIADVMYETYKARVSIDEVYKIIEESYKYALNAKENILMGFDTIIKIFIEDIPKYTVLLEEVGVEDLLDNGYIIGEYKEFKERYYKELLKWDKGDKSHPENDDEGDDSDGTSDEETKE